MKKPGHKKPARPNRRASRTPVLYIHPAKQGADPTLGSTIGRPYGLIPVGIAALANLLRENGIVVQGINLPMEKKLNPAFRLQDWLMQRSNARIVLIDMHWYEHVYGALQVAQVCKQILPGVWTVLGGLMASGFAKEILENFQAVDFVIRGDAEQPLLSLVKQLLAQHDRSAALNVSDIPNLSYRDKNQIVENELAYCATGADLDRLNFVDIDFIEHVDEYYVHEYIVTDLEAARSAPDKSRFRGRWLCNARGCKYNCSYCGGCKNAHQALAGRKGIVPRAPAKMVQDLVRLAKQRVIQASLTFDLAELGEAYWREFFERLRRSGARIGLYNELFQLASPEFITDYAQSVDMAHSCMAISPLSGSEQVRRLNGKYYSNNDLFGILDLLKTYQFYIFVYFSLNLPGENEDTVRESIELARRICDCYPVSLLKILTSCHTIDPLCPMNAAPEQYGIETSMSSLADYYAYCRNTQQASPLARTEAHRGFRPIASGARSLEKMADMWDAARAGHETCWWPVPPSW